jgi:hypothetical protein
MLVIILAQGMWATMWARSPGCVNGTWSRGRLARRADRDVPQITHLAHLILRVGVVLQ